MMNNEMMDESLWQGLGPSLLEIEDESSMWNVSSELVEEYLSSARLVDRRTIREVEGLVKAGLGGNRSITSSWLLGLRSEARFAAGIEPIPLDRLGDYRVTEAWPVEVEGLDGVTAWALHQRCAQAALEAVKSREMRDALQASIGQATCPVCSVSVTGPSSDLCVSCVSVLEVVRFDRARELGRERVDGRATRLDLVDRWLAAQ